MQAFRDMLKGWPGKVLIALFALPFAVFGIQGLFTGSARSDVAAVVNGDEISNLEVNRLAELEQERFLRRMAGGMDASYLKEFMNLDAIKPQVLDQLINQELIRQSIKAEGLYVTEGSIDTQIMSMSQFHDSEGKFSQSLLKRGLVGLGYTRARFRQDVGYNLLAEQLQKGIGDSAFVISDEVKTFLELKDQIRDVALMTLPVESYLDKMEVSHEEISDYYASHQAAFQSDAEVKVDYIELSLHDFVGDEDVDESVIREEYDIQIAKLQARERRRASDILVETTGSDRSDAEALARIREAQIKLQGGADFGDVAKEYSENPGAASNGGDLGFASKGIYGPEIDAVLFTMEKGTVSDIVETDDGYHLIKLVDIEGPEIVSYEQLKPELVADIKEGRALEAMDDAAVDISRIAYESGDLGDLALQYKVEVQTTDWFTKDGSDSGPADSGAVVSAAFSDEVLNQGRNSDLIETDDSFFVVRLNDSNPSGPLAQDKVEGEIISILKQAKAKEKVDSLALEIRQKLKDSVPQEELATEYDSKWDVYDGLRREGSDVNPKVVTKVFEMPAPATESEVIDGIGLGDGDQIIIVLSGVTEGSPTEKEVEQQALRSQMAGYYGRRDFDNYVATLKAEADITVEMVAGSGLDTQTGQ